MKSYVIIKDPEDVITKKYADNLIDNKTVVKKENEWIVNKCANPIGVHGGITTDGSQFIMSCVSDTFSGIMLSKDGETWTGVEGVEGYTEGTKIAYGDGKIITLSPFGGSTYVSSNYGVTWQTGTFEQDNDIIDSGNICFVKDRFIIIFNELEVIPPTQPDITPKFLYKTVYYTTIDGLNFSDKKILYSKNILEPISIVPQIHYANNRLVVTTLNTVAISADLGETWTLYSDTLKLYDEASTIQQGTIAYGNKTWVIIGHQNIYYSTDLLSWESIDISSILTHTTNINRISHVCYGNDKFIYIFQTKTATGNFIVKIYTSYNVTDLIPVYEIEDSVDNLYCITGACYNNGRFVLAVGDIPNDSDSIFISKDGLFTISGNYITNKSVTKISELEADVEFLTIKDSGNAENVENIKLNADTLGGKSIDEINTSINSKMSKVVGLEGNLTSISNTGDLTDSGIKLSVYNGCLRITYDDGL